MEERRVHALDYVSTLRRRKWWLIVPIVLSVVVGVALVRLLPKEYRSTTTLGVAAPSVSPNLVNQAPTLDNEERLHAISQQLMSPQILARVAREEGLAAGGSVTVVNQLRRNIEITVPEPVAQMENRRLDAFAVSYSDGDPGRAQRVADRLASVFIEENSKTRATRAEDTSAFIAAQLASSQTRLADLEMGLRHAKESHMGQLPEQTQANLQTLSGLRQQLEANATALRGEQDRLSVIERQIEAVNQGASAASIAPRPGATGDAAQSPELRAMTLERELAAARAMYTDKHPEVLRLQEELTAARQDAAAERRKPVADRLVQLQVDPAYRQLAGDRDMARMRISQLEHSEADTRRQITVYQARVESAPMVEQQLVSVQRDYDLEKQQYSELSSKLHTSTIAENVEQNHRGEQFTVLYGATFPTEPLRPIPFRVMLMSVVAGICVGGALTLAREYFDRSVHDVRELKDEFELPVLGEVAHIQPV
jgi:succinoglycan biosynthesis transport protein ExoP